MSRLSRRQFLNSAVTAGLALAWPGERAHAQASAAPAEAAPLFELVPPSASHINWVHTNARSPQRYLPETLPPGVAFLDYDNDGWMDIYLVNTGPCDFYHPAQPTPNALYHNNRDGTFTDVTAKAGVEGGTFGMGVAASDYDNDGFTDLFVTAYGRCILYHNNGNGTFTDVTERAGVATPGWATSAVWFDYDNDGRLDLFACSFVDYSKAHYFDCGVNKLGQRFYCIPRIFLPTHSFLYHNNGDGTFTDVTRGTAIERSLGKGLGVVATDINNDGRMDLFVANDTVQNFLYVNRGNDGWDEIALAAGVGYSDNGQPRSGMGVDAVDLHGTGWEDLFVANVDHEMFSLYKNNHDETFTDVAFANGIAQATRLLSGWGLKFFDFDNDGRIDLFLADGHPEDMINKVSSTVHYREPLLLFRQGADGLLHDISGQAGPVFQQDFAARGLATGDFNNDGRVDVLVGVNGEAPLLLRNNAGQGNHWVGMKLVGKRCNRDAVGARLTWSIGGEVRKMLKNSGGSYLSSHDPRIVLGLGASTHVDWVEVQWPAPSGKTERYTSVPSGRYLIITEGEGISSGC
ncbi:MAG: CRTAC1 family protein [Acidobacteriota bacterium]|nr:CRTAC1 family protein [Acidobacteriota bacterium]